MNYKSIHLLTFIAHGKSDKTVEFEGGHEINPDAMKKIEKWISK